MRKLYGANVLMSTNGMSEEEWVQHRRAGIGGSDLGGILGVSPYSSPLSIWLAKVEGYQKPVGRAAHRGRMCEAWISDEAAKRNGWKVKRVNAILQHPEHHWMLANIDRIIVAPELAISEIKMINSTSREKMVLESGVLPEHELQCRWYMAVLDIGKCYITYDLPNNDPIDILITRDLEFEEHAISACRNFWELVESNQPPALDGSEDAGEWLKRRFNNPTEGHVDLPTEAAFLALQYQSAHNTIREAETTKELAKQKLEVMLGNKTWGRVDGYEISWKPLTTNRLDTDRLKKERPDLVKEYTKPTESRRFSIKEIKA